MDSEILSQILFEIKDTRSDISDLRNGQGELRQSQERMELRLENVEHGQDELRHGQDELRDMVKRNHEAIIIIEHEHGKKIDIAIEGIASCNEDIRLIRRELREHSIDIEYLKAVK